MLKGRQPTFARPRLTFEPFEITDQIPDLAGVQPELGHVRMPGDNTFTECLFK